MDGRRGVLLVGHDASRTGAPIAALSWLRWLADAASGAEPVEVWLDRGGPLVDQFAALAPTRVLGSWRHEAVRRDPAGRVPAPLRRGARTAERWIGHRRTGFDAPPVVVANTVAAWPTAASVTRRSRLVVWVHELDHTADRILGSAERRRELLAVTDHLVAVGDRVGTMLTERWGVPAGRVTVVDSFVDAPPPDRPAPASDLDVLGIGSLTARKGPDAFVAALAVASRHRPQLRGAWVGGDLESPTATLVRHDLVEAGLAEQVALVGDVDDLEPWWPAAGVLVHTAREDPAPLAVVEAAQRAIAVVTWDTGGAADLLRDAGCGHLVAPAGDLLGVARRLVDLLGDSDARTEAGRALQQAVAGRTTDQVAPGLHRALLGGPR